MLSIIIPYRESFYPDKGYRQKAFEYVENQFQNYYPDAEIIIGKQTNGEKEFCRSNAINNGVAKSTGDVLLISDADIIIKKTTLDKAFNLDTSFVIPFGICYNLNRQISDNIINGKTFSDREILRNLNGIRDIRPGQSTFGDKLAGGIQIITRKLFNKVNGMDERFKGWGYEDTHFCWKLMAQIGDYPILENEKIFHLWHPRDNQLNNANYYLAQKEKIKLGIKNGKRDVRLPNK
jgi:predicted glycosyltransferase involved in capsule biosynthesis